MENIKKIYYIFKNNGKYYHMMEVGGWSFYGDGRVRYCGWEPQRFLKLGNYITKLNIENELDKSKIYGTVKKVKKI